jgi:DNA-nicking Smr family endonuclease
MKFSIDDRVYIKSNDEEGFIEEFIGKDMASVNVNGKSYYAYLDDLDHPYLRWFLKSKSTPKAKAPHIDQVHPEKGGVKIQSLPTGIYLVFMPVYRIEEHEDVVDKVKIYLFNETFHDCRFDYTIKVQQKVLFQLDSVLLSGGQFYIHDLDFEDIASNPIFDCRFIDTENPALDNQFEWALKSKKLYEKLNAIRYANHAFFYHRLIEKFEIRKKEEVKLPQVSLVKRQAQASSKSAFDFEKAIRKQAAVIDLHIEALLPGMRPPDTKEILHIQLTECRKALDLALATHQHTLIIIHGIGKGVLKNEIFQLLNQTKGVVRYVNEYDIRYGYGATKVFFT